MNDSASTSEGPEPQPAIMTQSSDRPEATSALVTPTVRDERQQQRRDERHQLVGEQLKAGAAGPDAVRLEHARQPRQRWRGAYGEKATKPSTGSAVSSPASVPQRP